MCLVEIEHVKIDVSVSAFKGQEEATGVHTDQLDASLLKIERSVGSTAYLFHPVRRY